ncbi:unnamed protein product [Nesidiocoris tenuis]|uniref:Uncharacterized protein n=1 Tax=Nesidiocoris tenuis TaxID=355587 RepID=A0A6H5HEH4_9HEMI|nr:unnamed protein product [Nesidiocoris tenuis]CAB0016511.1 unnamed protein product [Nesidiocoris tenuis]
MVDLALYDSNWTNHIRQVRHHVIIMSHRLRIPLTLTAAGFVPANLITFTQSPSPGIQSVDDVPWRDPTSPIKPNVPERLENPPAPEDVQPERKGQEDPPKPSVS